MTIRVSADVRIALVVVALGAVAASAPAFQSVEGSLSSRALEARLPVVREDFYIVNASIRPLLLFWISRDNVGDARFTRREASGGRRALEFLVGSDPARAPRRINRWGFIAEELSPDKGEILGVMSESTEETIDEAKATIERQDDHGVFKVARSSVTANRAVGGTMTVQAPARLTYRELDAVLALIPPSPPSVRTLALPRGTHMGFLVAMESLLRASIGPCRTAKGARPKNVAPIPYVYNQTLFDVSLTSCNHEAQIRTETGTFADIVDGRFQLRNRVTKYQTDFRILYGASGDLREVPVRATFRPRWWLEIELVLDPAQGRRAQDGR
jgi:hypothetical protein